jgi:hypothetical protein
VLTSFETSWSFSCTGAPVTWQVPAGVTELLLDVRGANGAIPKQGDFFPGGFGGAGGRKLASVAVSPRQTLTIDVGCGAQGKRGGWGYGTGGNGGDGSVENVNGGAAAARARLFRRIRYGWSLGVAAVGGVTRTA